MWQKSPLHFMIASKQEGPRSCSLIIGMRTARPPSVKPLCRISTAPSYHRVGTNPLTHQPLEDIEDANSHRPSASPAMDTTDYVLVPGSKLGRDSPALKKTVHLWLCLPGAYCH